MENNRIIVVLDDGETFSPDCYVSRVVHITDDGWDAYDNGEWQDPNDIKEAEEGLGFKICGVSVTVQELVDCWNANNLPSRRIG